jgi:hypothetical protein
MLCNKIAARVATASQSGSVLARLVKFLEASLSSKTWRNVILQTFLVSEYRRTTVADQHYVQNGV